MAQEEEKQTKINLDPIIYALTNVSVGFNKEVFDFLMVSGNQGRRFRASPEHAKRVYLLLGKHLEEYEKQFGSIEAQLPQQKEDTQQGGEIGFEK